MEPTVLDTWGSGFLRFRCRKVAGWNLLQTRLGKKWRIFIVLLEVSMRIPLDIWVYYSPTTKRIGLWSIWGPLWFGNSWVTLIWGEALSQKCWVSGDTSTNLWLRDQLHTWTWWIPSRKYTILLEHTFIGISFRPKKDKTYWTASF